MPEAVTMDTIISTITSVFTSSIGWLGDVIEVIASNPILLLMIVCFPAIGFAVGLTRRMLAL